MKKKLFNFLGATALLAGFGFVANALNASPVAHEGEAAEEATVLVAYNVEGLENVGTVNSGTTEANKTVTVKGTALPCYNFKNSWQETAIFETSNGVKLFVEGGFAKGDTVEYKGCISNKDATKWAKIVVGKNNPTDSLGTKLYTPLDSVTNVYNQSELDVVTYKYVLEAAADTLILGRDGNTATSLTYVKVTRPANVAGGDVEEPGLAAGAAVKATWTVDTVAGANVLAPAVAPAAAGKADEMDLGSNLAYKGLLSYQDALYYNLKFNEIGDIINNKADDCNRVNFTMTADCALSVDSVSFDLLQDGWGDCRMRAYLYTANDTVELTSAVQTPTRNNETFDAAKLKYSYVVENVKLEAGESATLAIALFTKNTTSGNNKGMGLNNITIDATVAEGAGETPVEPEPETNTVTLDFAHITADQISGTYTETAYKADGSVQAWAHYQPIDWIKMEGFKLTFEGGNTAAAVYTNAQGTWDLRTYVDNVMTINAPKGYNMTAINFTNSSGKAQTIEASSGVVDTSNIAAVTWVNDSTKADMVGVPTLTLTMGATLRYLTATVTLVEDPNYVPTREVVPFADILGEDDPVTPADGSVLEDGVGSIGVMTVTEGELKGNDECKEAATLKVNGKTVVSITTADYAEMYSDAKLPNYSLMAEEAAGNWYTFVGFALAEEFIATPGSYVFSIPEGFFLVGEDYKTGAYELNFRVPGFTETKGEQIGFTKSTYWTAEWENTVTRELKGTVDRDNDTDVVTVVVNNFMNTGVNLSLAFNAAEKASALTFNTELEMDEEPEAGEEGGYMIVGENYPVATIMTADSTLVELEYPYIYTNVKYSNAKAQDNEDGGFATNYVIQLCMWGDNGSEEGLDLYTYLYVAVPEKIVYPDVTGTDAAVNWVFDGTNAIPEGTYSVPGVFSDSKVEFGEGYDFDRTRYIGGKGNPGAITASNWNVEQGEVLSFSATPAVEFVPTDFVITWANVKHGSAYFTITAERGDEVVVVAKHIQPLRTNEAATEVDTEEKIASYTNTYRIPVFEKNEGEIVIKVTCDQADKARGVDFANAALKGVVPEGVEIPVESVKELVLDMEGADIYDLSGRKVVGQPAPGIYVVVKGNKAVKAVIR